ncbi:ATP-binding protein [Bacteroides fragilis]|uniref:hybrid sensor histidine kinase/response regulator transcription factor n=1 Tax=Bacteroides fragilis TaxID=817 RepID=UPI0023658BF5|nr:ATP-binding protein [Bacteroides fragilis]
MSLEKERIEKEHIEEMNQAKLRFFTNVSHEFRTPLTLIISQVELMLQKNTIPPSLHNSIFRIRKHAQQMKLLISELLDFRKFDQNYIQLKLSEQSLNTFLEEVYLSFSAYASQKSISYHLKLLEQDISIWIDDWQMRKVLFNLLSNAFKHVPDKGEISILTSTTPDQVVIAVKDSGNGISKEEQERIFDRFYQANNRNKAIHVGTGIGLALTKSIIQLHHGTIEVESELNEGSCFIVKLPKTRDCFEKDTEVVFLESPEKEPMVQENTIPDENFMKKDDSTFETPLIDEREEKRKVLLVEDNVELLQVLKEIFSSLYQVVTAANGEEGLKQAFAEVPDLIVSDVMMPVMTGTEMCLKIKNNINLCHIPVVLLTALDTVDQNIEGLRRGADDYITKPFNAKILITRCNNLIRNRLLMQSRFAKDQILEINLLAANPIDKGFLDRVIKVVDKHIDNEDFDIGVLCQELGMGRTLLHTKFKALTGMTPNEFILNHRLKIASLMLKNEPYLQVAEISDRLGFGSPRYFSRCFKNQYNVTPMEYRKGAKQENLK